MEKKPLILILISFCFFISPLFILVQASIAANAPVIGYNTIFLRLSPYDIVILICYEICAIAIFFVRKWGWYFFLLASFLLVAGNITVFLFRPQYKLLFAILYNLVLTVTAGLFFHRKIVTPYFHPRIRWWEQAERYVLRVEMLIKISGKEFRAEIIDLSSSGAFIEIPGTLPAAGDMDITIHGFGLAIELQAKVARTVSKEHTTGYGLVFCPLSPQSQKSLTSLLGHLEKAATQDKKANEKTQASINRRIAKRSALNTRTSIQSGQNRDPILLLDLSRSGCLIQMDTKVLPLCKKTFEASLSCLGISTVINCRPVRFGEREGQSVCGADFIYTDNDQKKAVKKIVNICKKIPTAKKVPVPISDSALQELAMKTPYKFVHKIKTIFVQTAD